MEPGPAEAPAGAVTDGVHVVPPSADQAPFCELFHPTRAASDGLFWAKSSEVSHSADEMSPRGRTDQGLHRSFFDTFSSDSPMRHLLRIHIGDVVAGPDRGAGAVEDMIGIEGINGETAQPPPEGGERRIARCAGTAVPEVQVRRERIITAGVVRTRIRLRTEGNPGRASIEAAIKFISGPPTIKGCDDHSVGMFGVHRDIAEAVPESGRAPRSGGRDVGPYTGTREVFPDCAIADPLAAHAIRARAVSVGHI
jgi:hypothetical protein